MDTIETKNGVVTSMVGRDAVEVFRLATLISALKLEIRCPGMKMSRHRSALQAAKDITGLKTNDRAKQLDCAQIMLEEAKSKVAYVERGDA